MHFLPKVMALTIALMSSQAFSAASEERVKLLLAYKQARSLFKVPDTDLKAALERRKKYTEVSSDNANRILSIGGRIYKEDNLFDVFVTAYAAYSKPQHVEAEIAMFESRAGLLYQAALAEMATSDFPSRVVKYWQTRDLAKLQQNRKNVIGSYIKQTKIAESQGVYYAGMDIAIDLSLNAFLRRNYRQTLDTIKRQTRLRKNNYVMDGADALIQNITFAFRELKNAQIDWVTRFYFSRMGEQSTQAYLNAIEITMDRAGETLMHSLNPDTKKPPTPPPSLAQPKPKAKSKVPTSGTDAKSAPNVTTEESQTKSGPPASKLKLTSPSSITLPANDSQAP